MQEKCFYCSDEIREYTSHEVTFFSNEKERKETLCPECYKEWLEGIKD